MNRYLNRLCMVNALLFVVAMSLPAQGQVEGDGSVADRPNVLFLLTDDQRTDTIAALGNDRIQTPNIDQLVASGTTFHQAYCQGSFSPAVCSPSRYQILSGRSVFHVLDTSDIDQWSSFPVSMNDAGYVTYHNGKKWNTPHEIHERFDHSRHLNGIRVRRLAEPGMAAVNNAISFIDNLEEDDRFFAYIGFAGPHDPRNASEEYLNMYNVEDMVLPANFMPAHPFDNGEMRCRDEGLANRPRGEDEIRGHIRDYYAVITQMDYEIGRLLDSLRESGRFDNTIIIFTSDHGLALGSHGLMGKQNLYEHSLTAPLVMSGPGIPHGENRAMCYLYDIYPTICELVGAEEPEGIDGISLLPVIEGETETAREIILTAYRDCQRAVRQGDWKIIYYPEVDITQLYHLGDDPDELTNLAEEPAHAAKLAEMRALLAEQRVAQDDWLPLD